MYLTTQSANLVPMAAAAKKVALMDLCQNSTECLLGRAWVIMRISKDKGNDGDAVCLLVDYQGSMLVIALAIHDKLFSQRVHLNWTISERLISSITPSSSETHVYR